MVMKLEVEPVSVSDVEKAKSLYEPGMALARRHRLREMPSASRARPPLPKKHHVAALTGTAVRLTLKR